MTELEIMRHAKGYIDKLANGVDPLTGNELPDSDIVNNVRISRCLFYVSGILEKVIANGGEIGKRGKIVKRPFSIDPALLSRYEFDDYPVFISVIVKKINDLINNDEIEKLKTSDVNGFLIKAGLLRKEESFSGKSYYRPTDAGRSVGISTEQKVNKSGTPYTAIMYNAAAQKFILDNIEAVIEISNSMFNSFENHGKPWTEEDEDLVVTMFGEGKSVKEIAVALKRKPAAVKSKMIALDLIDEE